MLRPDVLHLQPPAGRTTGTALYGVDSPLHPLGWDSRGKRSIEFGQLARKKQVLWEFRDQLRKLRLCYIALLLAKARQRQQDLRKRPEVAAVRSADLELLYAAALIAADSCEAFPGRLAVEYGLSGPGSAAEGPLPPQVGSPRRECCYRRENSGNHRG